MTENDKRRLIVSNEMLAKTTKFSEKLLIFLALTIATIIGTWRELGEKYQNENSPEAIYRKKLAKRVEKAGRKRRHHIYWPCSWLMWYGDD